MMLPLPHPLATGQRLAILGLSRSGVAAARLAKHVGVPKVILSNPTLPTTPDQLAWADELKALGVTLDLGQGHDVPLLALAQVIILSPGIPPHAEIVKRLEGMGLPLISELDWAFALAPSHWPWLAITGTNGKTTVTSLLHHLLVSLGHNAQLAGNIGIAPSDVVLQRLSQPKAQQASPVCMVTEVSSYQLAQSQLFAPRVGVITNLQPDHVAWHGSLDAYADAKKRLLAMATEAVVLNADDPTVTAWASEVAPPKATLWFSTQAHNLAPAQHPAVVATKEAVTLHPSAGEHRPWVDLVQAGWQLAGEHNAANLAACLAVLHACQPWLEATVDTLPLASPELALAIGQFKGVEHRLEPVATVGGVRVVNDSKATNPEASRLAMEALAPAPLWLLAGGEDKGTDLTTWAETAARLTQGVIVYGAAKERLTQALRQAGATVTQAPHLEAAWHTALSQAEAGHTIVLSPACASFDAFKDFEQRGHAFKQLVSAWVHRHATPQVGA